MFFDILGYTILDFGNKYRAANDPTGTERTYRNGAS